MMKPTELLSSYFKPVIEEYGFSVVREESNPEIMGNTVLVLMSDTTGIRVVIDRSQVLINLGKASLVENGGFDARQLSW